jgi:hypothetical protein
VAQFDIYRAPEGFGEIAYFLDVQSDLLRITETRVLVPLMMKSAAPPPFGRLNPIVIVKGRAFVAQFQDVQSSSIGDFGKPVDNLSKQRSDFVAAFDMLITGI